MSHVWQTENKAMFRSIISVLCLILSSSVTLIVAEFGEDIIFPLYKDKSAYLRDRVEQVSYSNYYVIIAFSYHQWTISIKCLTDNIPLFIKFQNTEWFWHINIPNIATFLIFVVFSLFLWRYKPIESKCDADPQMLWWPLGIC